VILLGCAAPPSATISGLVVDEHGPVNGAVVRIQWTKKGTITDEDDHFTLAGIIADEPITVSDWISNSMSFFILFNFGFYCLYTG